MKIDTRHIPAAGAEFLEELDPRALELGTEGIGFSSPVLLRARATMITNALTLNTRIEGMISVTCSRCLKVFIKDLTKEIVLNYRVDASRPVVDVDPDIREEIILDYPMKPLCSNACKGLCSRCGKNLNEGGCSCGIT